ncbi:hypothetical protein [Krasilnikoviella flava]|uniref:hypothetical protein n=1 Tax=Krasilnikoviella flava TaxID=526729 RepID=UPI00111C90BD|nr:hypothetical protein [Krasilnikoviella flava]
MWELNDRLPVDNVDVAYVQEELAVELDDQASCLSSLPEPVADECTLVDLPVEEGRGIVLWRPAEQVSDAMFAEGAKRSVYEDVTGRTKDGGTFRYRMNAWSFGDEEEAKHSTIFDAITACGASTERVGGADYSILEKDGEIYLLAYHNAGNVYLVETRIGRDDNNKPETIRDTPTGVLPSEAFEVIADWWAHNATPAL